jgi:hypothetical protein
MKNLIYVTLLALAVSCNSVHPQEARLRSLKIQEVTSDTIFYGGEEQLQLYVIRNWKDMTVYLHNYATGAREVQVFSYDKSNYCVVDPCLSLEINAQNNIKSEHDIWFKPYISLVVLEVNHKTNTKSSVAMK